MADRALAAVAEPLQVPRRISANLRIQLNWFDSMSGQEISVFGITEHIGDSGVLVNIELLPVVGSNVEIRLFEDEKTIVKATTTVIRIKRDPGKPLVALSLIGNFRNWREKAMDAAQEWVTRNWNVNYQEGYAN